MLGSPFCRAHSFLSLPAIAACVSIVLTIGTFYRQVVSPGLGLGLVAMNFVPAWLFYGRLQQLQLRFEAEGVFRGAKQLAAWSNLRRVSSAEFAITLRFASSLGQKSRLRIDLAQFVDQSAARKRLYELIRMQGPGRLELDHDPLA